MQTGEFPFSCLNSSFLQIFFRPASRYLCVPLSRSNSGQIWRSFHWQDSENYFSSRFFDDVTYERSIILRPTLPQIHKSTRLAKMNKFLKKSDDLDMVLHQITDNILSFILKIESYSFLMSDVEDMKQAHPPLHQDLVSNFCGRPTLTFQILQRCLTLHLFNPVEGNTLSLVGSGEEIQEDPRLTK